MRGMLFIGLLIALLIVSVMMLKNVLTDKSENAAKEMRYQESLDRAKETAEALKRAQSGAGSGVQEPASRPPSNPYPLVGAPPGTDWSKAPTDQVHRAAGTVYKLNEAGGQAGDGGY